MRSGVLVLMAMILIASSAVGAREIYRCVAPGGEVTYTNLRCPDDTSVQPVATYEPVPDMPSQTWQAAADAAEASAREARESAERARAALRAQQLAYQEPDYEAAPPPASEIAYVPLWVAPVGYAAGYHRHGRHASGHAHDGARTDVRGTPLQTPLSTIPFHTASPPSPLMYTGHSH